jgi:hypothetical protein
MIIVGSRGIDSAADYERLKAAVMKFPKPDEIVSGGAKGVDKLGERLAAEFLIPVKQFIPKWQNADGTTNKGAGFIRNGDMAVYASEHDGSVLVAMWDGVSRGTAQMIEVAKTYGLTIEVVAPAAGIIKDATPPEPFIFPQSHSSLSVFETCPRQYEAKYITREVKFVQGEAAAWGDKVHLALEGFLLSQGQQQLPPEMVQYQPLGGWVLQRAQANGGIIHVERKAGVKKDRSPSTYGAKGNWLQGKIDVTIVYPHIATAEVFDWKTNEKIKNDATQLKMYNGFTLTDFPDVETVRSGYVWLKHNQIAPPLATGRDGLDDIWAVFQSKYDRLRDAYRRGVFPERPNGLCRKHCDVLSCPHNGRR